MTENAIMEIPLDNISIYKQKNSSGTWIFICTQRIVGYPGPVNWCFGSTNTFVQQFTPPITKTENSQIGTPCSVLVAADAVADAVAVAVAAAVAVAVTVVMSTIHKPLTLRFSASVTPPTYCHYWFPTPGKCEAIMFYLVWKDYKNITNRRECIEVRVGVWYKNELGINKGKGSKSCKSCEPNQIASSHASLY